MIRPGRVRTNSLKATWAANAVQLQLHALAYNLGNFLRTLATPELTRRLFAEILRLIAELRPPPDPAPA